jgi:hypothetical protein
LILESCGVLLKNIIFFGDKNGIFLDSGRSSISFFVENLFLAMKWKFL